MELFKSRQVAPRRMCRATRAKRCRSHSQPAPRPRSALQNPSLTPSLHRLPPFWLRPWRPTLESCLRSARVLPALSESAHGAPCVFTRTRLPLEAPGSASIRDRRRRGRGPPSARLCPPARCHVPRRGHVRFAVRRAQEEMQAEADDGAGITEMPGRLAGLQTHSATARAPSGAGRRGPEPEGGRVDGGSSGRRRALDADLRIATPKSRGTRPVMQEGWSKISADAHLA